MGVYLAGGLSDDSQFRYNATSQPVTAGRLAAESTPTVLFPLWHGLAKEHSASGWVTIT